MSTWNHHIEPAKLNNGKCRWRGCEKRVNCFVVFEAGTPHRFSRIKKKFCMEHGEMFLKQQVNGNGERQAKEQP